MYVVYETLKQLGVVNKPVITLFNKQDKLEKPIILRDFQADKTLSISAVFLLTFVGSHNYGPLFSCI